MRLLRAAVIVAVCGVAAPASAGQLEILFDNGRVTVRATDVTLRQILQEWARQGQTRITGLEKLAGAPLTIELVDVPERQAIEILLRSVAGYMAAPRLQATGATESSYDRLMILATSVASPAPVGGPRPAAFAPVRPPVPMDPIDLANRDDNPAPEAEPSAMPVLSPVMDGATPVPPVGDRSGLRPPPIPGDPGGTPAMLDSTPQPEPVGPLTAPRPGILPVPQQPQPPRP